MSSRKSQERFFDKHPSLYPWPNLLVEVGFSKNYKPRDLKFKRYLDLLKIKKGDKVLDVGCGTGVFLARIAKTYGINGLGVDISKKSIATAKQWGSPRLHFKVADAAQLPYKNGSFDYVLSFDALEHIGDQKEALSEMVRVLKPKGLLLIYTINKNQRYTWNFWLNKLGIDIYGRVAHDPDLFLDPSWIRRELERVGVKVDRVELFNSFFTLAVDEAIMLFFSGLKRMRFFKLPPTTRAALGKIFLSVTDFFSRLFLTPLEILEIPWKRFGYSNSFFILGRKKRK